LRADEEHAERPAALGDVDQHVLQGAGPVTRRVLVELVENDHGQREPLPGVLLLLEGLAQERADDEPLRLLVQRLDRDHRDVGGGAVDPSVPVRADQVAEPPGRRVHPPEERRDRPGHHLGGPGRIRVAPVLRFEVHLERAHERREVRDHDVGLGGGDRVVARPCMAVG
jgi:hypothetical protein